MKKFLFLLTCGAMLVHTGTLKAQGGLLLNGGVKMVCSNAPFLVIEDGNWKNSSSTFTSANSTVKFSGSASTANSTVEGNTTFNNLELAKSSNDLLLFANTTTIKDQVIFTSGKLNLGSKTLSLNALARFIGESESSRTYGALVNGKAIKTQPLNNPVSVNAGNLGAVFTVAGNLGNTTVDRRHAVQTLPMGSSIQKHWRIAAANPAGWNATLRFYYFDAELNGLNEGHLNIWRSIDNGLTWTNMGFVSRSSAGNYVEQTAIADVSGWWTLGAPGSFTGPLADQLQAHFDAPAPQLPELTWRVFPNPAGEWIHFFITSAEEQALIMALLDATGKIIRTNSWLLLKGENRFSLDISHLAPGMYFARIDNQTYRTLQVIKTNTSK